MILAGVVVGKYGFNILERDSSFELFGKVGLYYIMFLAGLEMDMDDFKKNRTKGLVFGMFTFLIPMGLGIWSSMSMLNYGFLTSVLLASMYASHTLIAYPIISRYGLSRQRTVSITIGGTAVTVVLALMVLAVIGGMYKGEDVGGLFWVLLVAKVVLLFGLIIFLMPRISRWFFRTYEDAVMQFIFVLAMVFLGGGLMELVGMEGILGAFLAGLVLNRFVPHVSPLMNRLITNLPTKACVEVPCLVDASGITPCYVGDLPEQCAALNRTNINVQLMTIEAAMTRRKEAIYQAAMLDPHLQSELSIDDIVSLCDDLIAAHQGWLPEYK